MPIGGDASNTSERSSLEPRPFDVLGLAISLAKHRRLIIAITASASAIGVVVSLLMPPIYTATAVLMPPQQAPADVFSSVGQLSINTGGSSSLGSALGLKSQNDLYVGILRSRTIADGLIEKFELRKLYGRPTVVDTRRALERRTEITATKEGLIQIDFEDEDPKRAADVANAYVQALEGLTRDLAISEAAQRRKFFEQRVDEASKQLARAEQALTAFRTKTGLIARVDDQGKTTIETIANLHVQIMMREAQVAGMRSYATYQNPRLTQLLREIDNLKRELKTLKSSTSLFGGDISLQTGNVAEIAQDYVTRIREVKVYEQALEVLGRQLEQARIDEGKNPTIIQVVDSALVPDKKTRPRRLLIVIFLTAVGFFLASLAALLIEWRRQAVSDPLVVQRMRLLKSYLLP